MALGGSGHRSRSCVLVTVAVLAALLSAVPATAATAAPSVAPADGPSQLKPVQVVVLADESGSLSGLAVDAEKDGANTIAQDVLGPGSTVSIVGFGTDVTTYCSKVVLSGQQQRDELAECIDKIHKRDPDEGPDTDHILALRQAKSLLDDGGDQPKIIFLLTDGDLDVHASTFYGKDLTPDARQQAAEGQIPAVKAELQSIKAQVWPLGYGAGVQQSELDRFTTGVSCGGQEPNPSARVIGSADDLVSAVKQAFQSATCVKFGVTIEDPLPSGGQLALKVSIPRIASDASILVFKGDPGLVVAFQGPSGQSADGISGPDGARYDRIGQQTTTETLHVLEPKDGTWTIVVSSKPGTPPQQVRATVAYQTAVSATISLDYPNPPPGQDVRVDMTVQARGATITDPDALEPLTFVVKLAGDGFSPPPPVNLTDSDGDGRYSGTITVPKDATGKLTVTGRVSGVGVDGDTRSFPTNVLLGPATLQGNIALSPDGVSVRPGDTIKGSVGVTNSGAGPAHLVLQADGATPGLTLAAAPVEAAVGSSQTPFELHISLDAPVGGAQVQLRLIDTATDKDVADTLFATDVAPAPTLVERLWWLWVVLAALLVVAVLAIVTVTSRRRRRVAVGGLKARLYRNGALQPLELIPRNPKADSFRFVLQTDFHGVSLQHAGSDDPDAWVVTRTSGGLSMGRSGDGRDPTIAPGEQREIAPDLAVAIVDERGSALGGAASAPNPYVGYNDNPFGNSAPQASSPMPQQRPADEFSASYADPFVSPDNAAPPSSSGGSYDANNPF